MQICTFFVRALLLIASLAWNLCALAAQPPSCISSIGPDVTVGDLVGWGKWGTVGQITGYTFGTTSCNLGDAPLPWIADSNSHPVIASNAYRLSKDGRFEQIGMSWVKHGWGASAESVCCTCIDPNNFEALGVGCSDPYDAATNAIQAGFFHNGVLVAGLGPRSEINPRTGEFPWPFTSQGQGGNAIYKRLQIKIPDLDPDPNEGARYFAEAQYITPHDNFAGTPNNNVGYREFVVGSLISGGYTLSFPINITAHRGEPAILAWQAADPAVDIHIVDIPEDGRLYLASRVTPLRDGNFHYEYALFNMNSHAAVRSFAIPRAAQVSMFSLGFHDVDYHSGEMIDGTDWETSISSTEIMWSTSSFASNPNANALRWGSLYNFRFDSPSPPHRRRATLGTFRTGLHGVPTEMHALTQTPMRLGDANDDDEVDVDDILAVITAWGRCSPTPAACPADVAPPGGDGVIGINDLLAVISNWG
jgi:hypothetical protein